MAGDALVGEAPAGEVVGVLLSAGPAGEAAAARRAAAAAASALPQWLAINPSSWLAVAEAWAAAAALAGAQVGGPAGAQVGAAHRVGVAAGVTAPPVGAVVMVGPPATAAGIR